MDKENTAVKEERSNRKTLKGPLYGLFEHANDLIEFAEPPQPQPSASRTYAKSDKKPQREGNREIGNVNLIDNVNTSDRGLRGTEICVRVPAGG